MFRITFAKRITPTALSDQATDTNYATEAEAQAFIDDAIREGGRWNSAHRDGYVFGVFPVPWQVREQTKLINGTHKPPVWYLEKKITDYATFFKDHFPHVSVEDPTMLAYTPNDEYGQRDRQNRIKPGKYLQKYYGKSEKTGLIGFGPRKGHTPILTPQEIAYYAEWWETGSKPSRFASWELRFAETPEDIAKIYRDGPRSCMSQGQVNNASVLSKAPTRVYGAGDLQLAYLWDPETKKPRARALTWPAKEVFGRCYPASQNYITDGFSSSQDATDCENELRARLRAKGWTDIKSRSNVFDGAKLLMEASPESGKNHYRMPYLDNSYNVDVSEDGANFIMKLNGMYPAQHTSGVIFITKKFRCDHCASSVEEFNRYNESQIYKVFTVDHEDPKADLPEAQNWCSNCSRHSYICRGLNVRLAIDVFPQVRVNGTHHSMRWADQQKDLYSCQFTGNRYSVDRYPSVKTKTGVACAQNVTSYGFVCGHDGLAYKMDEASRIWCGFPKTMDTDKSITPEDRAKHDLRTRVQKWSSVAHGWTVENDLDFSTYLYHFHDIHSDYLRRKERDAARKEIAARDKERTDAARVSIAAE